MSIALTLYSGLAALGSPLVVAALAARYGVRRTAQGLPERFGAGLSSEEAGGAWFHAASVGEVKAAESILRAFRTRFPEKRLMLTTTNATGAALARSLGLADEIRLAPLDFSWMARRYFRAWRPGVLVLVETELWPNWLETAHRHDVPVVVLNARLSDKAFPVYRSLAGLWRPFVRRIARVGAQTAAHAERWRKLGVPVERVVVTGNLKNDVEPGDPASRPGLRTRFGFSESDKVWVCGSTHPGEDQTILEAFRLARARDKTLVLALAPRHTARASDVAALAKKEGFSVRLRSSGTAGPADVLILDTLGELSDLYGTAFCAFLGGSLVARGGQNPLEACRWSIPVLAGPHMENFAEAARNLSSAGALATVPDAAGAADAVVRWLDERARSSAGAAARRVLDEGRGAVKASLDLLRPFLERRP